MRKFLSWLWEHCGDGYIELRVLPPRTDGIIHHFTDLDSACSFASDRSVSTPIRFDLNTGSRQSLIKKGKRFNPDTVRFEP